MNRYILYILPIAFITLFTACGGQQQTEEVKPSLTVDQLEIPTTLTVQIEGMACPQGCARPIQDKCAELAGVAESRVDFASGLGYFTFDAAKMSEKDIIACIEGANGGGHYKATPVVEDTEQEESSTEEPADDTETVDEANA